MNTFANLDQSTVSTSEESVVELNELQLALVGGGIGDTILGPK